MEIQYMVIQYGDTVNDKNPLSHTFTKLYQCWSKRKSEWIVKIIMNETSYDML